MTGGAGGADRAVEVVVVGGGIAGMSLAAELAAAGSRGVVLVEAEDELARHTTGRSAASYVPGHGPAPTRGLIAASRARFDAIAEEAGAAVLTPRPVLHVAHDEDQERTLHRDLLPLDPVTALTVDEAVARWPALRADRLRAAAVVESACDADPMGLHQHYRRRLRAHGGSIRTAAPVTALAPRGDGWRVELGGDHDHLDTAAVVLAAGAWTDRLLALAGAEPIGLRPLRRTVAIARVPPGAPVRRDDPFVVAVGERWYAKPEGEHLLVSPSEETPAEPGDPRPDPLDVAAVLERLDAVTTLGLRSVVTSWTGLRTFAPDRLLVIGERRPGLHVFAGQGGSGIETAPAAAALAASVVRGDAPPSDVVAALAAEGTSVGVLAAHRRT